MSESEPPSRCVFLTDETGTIQAWNDGCSAVFGVAVGRQTATIVLDGER